MYIYANVYVMTTYFAKPSLTTRLFGKHAGSPIAKKPRSNPINNVAIGLRHVHVSEWTLERRPHSELRPDHASTLALDEYERYEYRRVLEKISRDRMEECIYTITFKEFKDGKVTVMLKGSCSGCPSSTLTLKQGVQNLLCHYIPEVKEVLAV